MADTVASLRSQLHEVKERASNQNAELERQGREIKRLTQERDKLKALEKTNGELRDELKQTKAALSAAENARATAEGYAQANEGAARRLQQIKEALA